MVIMDQFIIRCTEEQTKKARLLGAPLNLGYHSDDFAYAVKIASKHYAEIPTAETMIGWLEEQDDIKSIVVDKTDCWQYVIWGSDGSPIWCDTNFKSRREATLAAIDKVLEHLDNNE